MGIVMVNYGSAETLRTNYGSVLDRPPWASVFVVDCFLSVRERHAVEDVCAEFGWRLVPLATNAGFGGGANAGAQKALEQGCRSLIFLNPDTRTTRSTLQGLAQEVDMAPRSIASPLVRRVDGSIWHEGAQFDAQRGDIRPLESEMLDGTNTWLSGACLAVSSAFWRELGGFDTRYFLYWEDVDLSYRCHAAGGRLTLRRDLECVHEVGGTQPGHGKSAIYFYYNCRNRLTFAQLNLEPVVRRRWRRRTVGASWEILRRQGRRGLLREPALVWAGVRGSIAGLSSHTGGTPRAAFVPGSGDQHG